MPRSIASIAISNDSFDHLPLGFIGGNLFILVGLCVVMFDLSLKRGILLVHYLLVHHYILSSVKGIEHHEAFGFPGPNLQKLGGMCLGPTSGIVVSFLCSNQENKKCVRLGNLFNACSYVKTLVFMISKMFGKSVQPKSSFVIVVHVVECI
jgi:hypothetical protein